MRILGIFFPLKFQIVVREPNTAATGGGVSHRVRARSVATRGRSRSGASRRSNIWPVLSVFLFTFTKILCGLWFWGLYDSRGSLVLFESSSIASSSSTHWHRSRLVSSSGRRLGAPTASAGPRSFRRTGMRSVRCVCAGSFAPSPDQEIQRTNILSHLHPIFPIFHTRFFSLRNSFSNPDFV